MSPRLNKRTRISTNNASEPLRPFRTVHMAGALAIPQDPLVLTIHALTPIHIPRGQH